MHLPLPIRMGLYFSAHPGTKVLTRLAIGEGCDNLVSLLALLDE